MNLSDLIKALQQQLTEHGDMPVTINDMEQFNDSQVEVIGGSLLAGGRKTLYLGMW